MTVRNVITDVLDKRHKQVLMLEKVHNGLAELEMQMDSLQQMAEEVLAEADEIPQDIASLTSKIATYIGGPQEGKARQGKSTLLQKISGLSNKEIPTSDELPCTGTKSKIYHSEDDAYAKIEFYSKEEFLKEILHPYFDKLKISKPFSLKRFGEPLSEAFSSYAELLSKPPKTLELEEILNYVTQGKGRTRYLAVKSADIYTKFPNHDVTGLCLVDLPGLEAAQGHEMKLVSSLEHEVDAVIFVKSPDVLGTDWEQADYNVFDLVDNAVREVELANRLFIVLNEKNDGSNKKQVQLLKEQPPETYSKPRILTADCSDAQAVEEKVFSVVLQHIEKKLESTDQQYIKALADKMEKHLLLLVPLMRI